MSKKGLSEQQKDEVLKLYNSGLDGPQISKQVGFSKSSVYRALKNRGVKPRKLHKEGKRQGCKKFDNKVEEQMLKEYLEGDSFEKISDKYGCCVSVIRRLVLQNGYKPRSPADYIKSKVEDNEELKRQIVDEYLKYVPIYKLSKKYKISNKTCRNVLMEFGVTDTNRTYSGEHSLFWRGGRKEINGYIIVSLNKEHKFYCMAMNGGKIFEHRLVMAQHLNRPLSSTETVHHIDGNKKNNKIENLQLRQGKHGRGIKMCCADCGSTNIIEDNL